MTLILFEILRISLQNVLNTVHFLLYLLKHQLNTIVATRRSLSFNQQEFTEWTEEIAFVGDVFQNLI